MPNITVIFRELVKKFSLKTKRRQAEIKKHCIFVHMDKFGQIEIRITGKEGNNPLTPDNYDIRDIKNMLENIEDILYPNKKKERPVISYNIKEGSVKNIFKTSVQAVVQFTAVASLIASSGSIDSLELPTAKAIENIQNQALTKNYSFEIKTSASEEVILNISPETKYVRSANLWIDAEFYFYGVLTNAGGKTRANIHLDTKEAGSLTIDAEKEFLTNIQTNLLYKEYGVRVRGKQNVETGEIDKSSLILLELIDYSPRYDEQYLNNLIEKANHKFNGLDADKWLAELRGGYDD